MIREEIYKRLVVGTLDDHLDAAGYRVQKHLTGSPHFHKLPGGGLNSRNSFKGLGKLKTRSAVRVGNRIV